MTTLYKTAFSQAHMLERKELKPGFTAVVATSTLAFRGWRGTATGP
jgi:hypothetical protein